MVKVLLALALSLLAVAGCRNESSSAPAMTPSENVAPTTQAAGAPGTAPLQSSWRIIPAITLATSRQDDPRVAAVNDAVQFWNEPLQGRGSAFRLGLVTTLTQPVPDQAVVGLSQAV